MRCLVTGATGAVGPRLVQALSAAGHRVRMLSRNQPGAGVLPEGVEVCCGDITEPATVEAAMRDVEVAFHLAALLHIVNPPAALQARFERVNVGGTATVVQAAVRAGLRRVVFFSTIAVYGDCADRIINEDSPPHPQTCYARTKLSAEQRVLRAVRSDGKALGTVLRLGTVYGSRIKGNYRQLVHLLARGRFIPVGDGRNRRTLLYDRDVASAAVLAMDHPSAAGQVYNVSDGQFHRLRDIIAVICDALGRRPPRFSLPLGPVRFAAGVLEGAARLLGQRSPIGRAMIDKYTEDVAVEGRRIQAELGFVPQYNLATGWREAILEMRQAGQL